MTPIRKRIPLKWSLVIVHRLGRKSLPDSSGGSVNSTEPYMAIRVPAHTNSLSLTICVVNFPNDDVIAFFDQVVA